MSEAATTGLRDTDGPHAVRVVARAPDAEAFAPFGAFLEPPALVGDRAHFGEWLHPVSGRSQQCHLNRVAPVSLPLVIDRVESHPHAAQIFLPMGVPRYLVTVMPSHETGAPDPARARAFVVPGTLGVVYRPGAWHTGISVLDGEGSFAVLMWRGGEGDDVFVHVPPIEVRAEADRAVGVNRG